MSFQHRACLVATHPHNLSLFAQDPVPGLQAGQVLKHFVQWLTEHTELQPVLWAMVAPELIHTPGCSSFLSTQHSSANFKPSAWCSFKTRHLPQFCRIFWGWVLGLACVWGVVLFEDEEAALGRDYENSSSRLCRPAPHTNAPGVP